MTLKRKILIVFGTRPEAIKMAPLVKAFENHKADFETKVCVTAQHREMLDQVLDIFEIQPEYDLDLMKKDQDLYDVTSNILLSFKSVLDDFSPDLVLVHGDTTTTFSVSLSCYYKKIAVGHVEAGLRTGDIYSPWPEEVNRKLTGAIANYHFAPTEKSKENLLKENVSADQIVVTGNTVVDALFLALNKIEQNESIKERLAAETVSLLPNVNLEQDKIVLITGHRRENFGEGFRNICAAIKDLAKKFPATTFVYPVHLNPNVKGPVNELLTGISNVRLIAPLGYLSFIHLMSKSYLILTDSGGIQEEAPSLGKPVLVMRDTTERPEAVHAGTVKLVGTDKDLIIAEVSRLIEDKAYHAQMSNAINPYGDGKACERIIDHLK
ncbi:MAG: UDP-N-acetylglucosamine 2-epimerase (non-hydrolyzing) [Crocinitomix sp.]|nr:UDP-N-acetylglucosamine 2-epimerase (non-hydrolyzing) [Crocinitomix sp.]